MKAIKKKIGLLKTYMTISLCVFLLSCATDNTIISKNINTYTLNFDSIEQRESLIFSSIFKSVKAIVLDNKEVLIGKIEKMQPYESTLFILDSQSAKGVYEFRKNGEFIRKIGSVGNGPGEYNACNDFTINEQTKEIYIYDSYNKRINKYDIETGAYKSSLNIEAENTIDRIWYNSGRLYAVNTFFRVNQKEPYYILQQLDITTGKKVDYWMNASQYNKGWKDELFHTNLFYRVGENTDLFAFGLSDSIMCIREGELYPYISLSGKKVVSTEDISKDDLLLSADPMTRSKKTFDLYMRLGKQDKIMNISSIYESDQMLYIKCRAWQEYTIQFDKRNGEALMYTNSEDDILFSKSPNSYTIPNYLTSDKRGVYYIVQTDFLSEIKSFASRKGVISDKVVNKNKLENLDEDSNPLILYYEYKK